MVLGSGQGSFWGLLSGVNLEHFEVEDSCLGTYSLSILVRNRLSNHRFWFVNVYGPAQHNLSAEFIEELQDICNNATFPILMGGDFNLIRNNFERNHGVGDPQLMELFNNFIASCHLKEIYRSGSKFTWSNKQLILTLVKLDRILVSPGWDEFYSGSFAWSKARVGSDHCPIIIDSGEQRGNKSKYFFFQERWLSLDGFWDMVNSEWHKTRGDCGLSWYSMKVWHDCLQALMKFLRGWNLGLIGKERKLKANLTKKIEGIDQCAESRLLSFEEWEERIRLEKQIEELSNMEMMQWKQKAGKN